MKMDSLPPKPPADAPLPDLAHAATPDLTTSALLKELAETWAAERIAVIDLVHAFGARGYGLLMFVFALPNMIPNPFPGLSSLLGAPLLILAWQMARGMPEPWLPKKIANRSIATAQLRSIAQKAGPWLARVERYIRPRPGWITGPGGERLIGWASLVLSIPVLLPGPGTNGPPSWAIGLMAIGFLARDRMVIYAGLAWGVIAMGLGIGGLYVGWMLTVYLFGKAWGFLGGLF
jgi:hypothetical protein